jgi:hypothetical protein
VFPLPGLVLFPHAVLPLHIFELRYRTMVRDTLSSGRMLATALLKPGWEPDYHGSPEFYPIGCLARVDEVEWLPNDCYNLQVIGLSRVRFSRVEREYPYRAARIEVLPQAPYDEDDPLIQMEKGSLLETLRRMHDALSPEAAGEAPSWTAAMRFEALVNAMCMFVEAAPLDRLALLELDSVIERSRRARELAEQWLRRAEYRERPEARGGEQN